MIKMYFALILRHLRKDPVNTSINIFSFAVSLAVLFVLVTYSYQEVTTDQVFNKVDRTYMVRSEMFGISTPAVLHNEIDQKIPAIETAVRLKSPWNEPVVQYGKQDPLTTNLLFADPTFFEVFDYEVLHGDLATALEEPYSLVLRQRESERIFGNDPPIGKTLKLNNKFQLTVRAVIVEPVHNTSLRFDGLISMSSVPGIEPGSMDSDWGNHNVTTLVVLNEKQDPNHTVEALNQLTPNHFDSALSLVPYSDIYFSETLRDFGNLFTRGNLVQIKILLLVAILILIISIINFVNLTTAQLIKRGRESGINKVLGASRKTIFAKVLLEAFTISLSALVIGFMLVHSAIPFLNEQTGLYIHPKLILVPEVWAGVSLLALMASVLAGVWPAVFFSSVSPVSALMGIIPGRIGTRSLQNALVVVQFTVTIVLIAFTIIVQKQVSFGAQNLGFDQENIIGMEMTGQLHNKKDVLKNGLLGIAGVQDISFSQFMPGKGLSEHMSTILYKGQEKQVQYNTVRGDPGFPEFMGLALKEGRFFSTTSHIDEKKVLVNEAFLREYEVYDPLNTILKSLLEGRGQEVEIIGVVKDFHFRGVQQPITPLVIQNYPYATHCFVKVQDGDYNQMKAVLDGLKAIATDLSPDFPVQIQFLDQAVQRIYEAETTFRKIFTFFSVIAIIIACVGLLGLTMNTVQKRTKEIAIRKINGAMIFEMVKLLSQDIAKWVILSFVVACPIAWLVMHQWLQNFAYRTTPEWWMFVLAGMAALCIALLTVSYHTVKAARANPVRALRYE